MGQTIGSLIGIAILLRVSFWIAKDAKSRGMDAMGWAVFTLCLMLFAIPAYFLLRKEKLPVEGEPEQTDEVKLE